MLIQSDFDQIQRMVATDSHTLTAIAKMFKIKISMVMNIVYMNRHAKAFLITPQVHDELATSSISLSDFLKLSHIQQHKILLEIRKVNRKQQAQVSEPIFDREEEGYAERIIKELGLQKGPIARALKRRPDNKSKHARKGREIRSAVRSYQPGSPRKRPRSRVDWKELEE